VGQKTKHMACNGRQANSKYSRPAANEAVKDVFEDKSEQQCSVQKCGQALLDLDIPRM
jgi:hypothetical protein